MSAILSRVLMNTRTRSAQIQLDLAKNLCTEALVVQHNERNKEFFVEIGKDKAVLNYDEFKPGHIDMHHTEVPVVFRGKGVAQLLAKSAFDHVVQNDMKMRLTCTYLQKYLKENPNGEYLKRVV